jgi:glycosyltransferase involved in cell wall biosynthesis
MSSRRTGELMLGGVSLLGWLVLAAFAAYPLAAALPLLASTGTAGALGAPSGSFSWLLPLSMMLAYAATPSRSLRFGAHGAPSAIKSVVLWTVASQVVWLTLLFLFGSLDALDRSFLVVLAGVQATLLTTGAIVRLGGLFAVAALLAALGTIALAGPHAPADASGWPLDRLFGGTAGAVLLFLTAAGLGALLVSHRFHAARSLWRSAALTGVWTVGTHVLWIAGLVLAGAAGELPAGLPWATGFAMIGIGTVLPLIWSFRRGTLSLGKLAYSPVLGGDPNAWPEIHFGTGTGSRRAWVISYTGVSNEPRVLRQCEALIGDGWEVVVCGYDGHSPRPAAWTFVRLPATAPFRGSVGGVLRLVQGAARRAVVHGPRWLAEPAAHVVHGATPLWLHTRLTLLKLARENPDLKPDLVISHDYHTADVGYALARRFGSMFSIDVHEYAPGQYFNDSSWVKWQRPVAVIVNDHYLRRADLVTVVSEGIAELLARESPMRRPPVVIRSVPFKNVQPFRPVGERITVLYHGDLSQRREIHTAIASVRFWRDGIDLLLRGSGDPAYMGELRRLVQRYNLDGRVRFEPPVPFDQIVPAANGADIGFFSFTGHSPQIRFTLPNKVFEYVMAGLRCASATRRRCPASYRGTGTGG